MVVVKTRLEWYLSLHCQNERDVTKAAFSSLSLRLITPFVCVYYFNTDEHCYAAEYGLIFLDAAQFHTENLQYFYKAFKVYHGFLCQEMLHDTFSIPENDHNEFSIGRIILNFLGWWWWCRC